MRVARECDSVCVCERKPEGSEAVFTFSSFLLDLCLSMICLHLFLQYTSVEDTAGKLHRGKGSLLGYMAQVYAAVLKRIALHFKASLCTCPTITNIQTHQRGRI